VTRLSENQDEVASVTEALNLLSNELTDMHGSCDFVFDNFEVRQKAAADEVEAVDLCRDSCIGRSK